MSRGLPFFTRRSPPEHVACAERVMEASSRVGIAAQSETALAAPLGAVEQLVEVGPVQIDLIKLAVKVAREVAEIAGESTGEQQSGHPLQPDQPVERGRGV